MVNHLWLNYLNLLWLLHSLSCNCCNLWSTMLNLGYFSLHCGVVVFCGATIHISSNYICYMQETCLQDFVVYTSDSHKDAVLEFFAKLAQTVSLTLLIPVISLKQQRVNKIQYYS